jgi:hypothetical protein
MADLQHELWIGLLVCRWGTLCGHGVHCMLVLRVACWCALPGMLHNADVGEWVHASC